MKNYLLLFSGGSMPTSEADQRAEEKVWRSWFSTLGKAVVDEGRPVMPQGRTVSRDGHIIPVTGGSAPSGYTVLKANSLDEAVRLTKDCPIFKQGGEVMVYETIETRR